MRNPHQLSVSIPPHQTKCLSFEQVSERCNFTDSQITQTSFSFRHVKRGTDNAIYSEKKIPIASRFLSQVMRLVLCGFEKYYLNRHSRFSNQESITRFQANLSCNWSIFQALRRCNYRWGKTRSLTTSHASLQKLEVGATFSKI